MTLSPLAVFPSFTALPLASRRYHHHHTADAYTTPLYSVAQGSQQDGTLCAPRPLMLPASTRRVQRTTGMDVLIAPFCLGVYVLMAAIPRPHLYTIEKTNAPVRPLANLRHHDDQGGQNMNGSTLLASIPPPSHLDEERPTSARRMAFVPAAVPCIASRSTRARSPRPAPAPSSLRAIACTHASYASDACLRWWHYAARSYARRSGSRNRGGAMESPNPGPRGRRRTARPSAPSTRETVDDFWIRY
ncbi:hypothetical protein C8R45DRAFT_561391 [Mycena sanguinolenta]|nr:hypothetical protein C8R45DRAFT_561391 [Mycena sanguinolenta]